MKTFSAISVHAYTSMTEIIVGGSNPKYSSIEGVLFNKNKTMLVKYPEGKTNSSYEIPGSVTTIGEWAFSECTSLTRVTIPNSVTSIGEEAFASCANLTRVTIPNSVTNIGKKVFYSCKNLKDIQFPSGRPPAIPGKLPGM